MSQLIAELYLTEACTMRCRYCYLPKRPRRMTWEVARKAVDLVASRKVPSTIICFFGGEPLLEWELLVRVVAYARRQGIRRFNICTNGLAITRRRAAQMAAMNLVPMFSIDGAFRQHDRERLGVRGRATHARVVRRIKEAVPFFKGMPVQVQITVTPGTVDTLRESVGFIRGAFPGWDINLVPAAAQGVRYRWDASACTTLRAQCRGLGADIAAERRAGVSGSVSYMCCAPQRDLAHFKAGRRASCFCAPATRHLSVTVEGEVYPCFFFAGLKDKAFRIGDVHEGLSAGPFVRRVGEAFSRRPGVFTCWAGNAVVRGMMEHRAGIYETFDRAWAVAAAQVRRQATEVR
jgi:uncharacterized protein